MGAQCFRRQEEVHGQVGVGDSMAHIRLAMTCKDSEESRVKGHSLSRSVEGIAVSGSGGGGGG